MEGWGGGGGGGGGGLGMNSNPESSCKELGTPTRVGHELHSAAKRWISSVTFTLVSSRTWETEFTSNLINLSLNPKPLTLNPKP